MKEFLDGNFYSPTKGNLALDQVADEIIRHIQEKPEKFYDVIVGCDSSSSEEPTFPLVIVILRLGEGGRFFLKRIEYGDRKFYIWRQRILQEVLLSCDLALYLKELLNEKVKNLKEGKLNYQFRYIHADIGENGGTKDMVKELTGLIRGSGFEPKIKPESFVASSIADRFS